MIEKKKTNMNFQEPDSLVVVLKLSFETVFHHRVPIFQFLLLLLLLSVEENRN